MRSFARTGAVLAVVAATTVLALPAGATEDFPVSPYNKPVTVAGRGVGDGVGLSVAGAAAAEAAGRTDQQVLDFYLPGSTPGTVPAGPVRVRLDSPYESTALTVLGAPGLQVRDELTGTLTALPDTAAQHRIVSTGAELRVERSADGTTWTPVPLAGGGTGSTGNLTFTGPAELRPLFLQTTAYGMEGTLTAIRSGTSRAVRMINTLTLDQYVAAKLTTIGAPPSRAAAVVLRAWAAARRGAAGDWDVCSSETPAGACSSPIFVGPQYRGRWRHDPAGTVDLQAEARPATVATSGVVRVAGGAPVGRWTTSDGGWTAAGGAAWLPARQDPYEPAGQDTWTDTVDLGCVPAGQVPDRVSVLARDGAGRWGGRVTALRFSGPAAGGARWQLDLTGPQLATCLARFRSTLFTFDATWNLDGAPAAVRAPDGSLDVVSHSPAGDLYARHASAAGVWEPWQAVGGKFLGAPAIERSATGTLTVWVQGGNKALYSITKDAAGWGAWRSWGGGLDSRPSPAVLADGSRVVVALGTDLAVWVATWTKAGTFQGWRSLGGAFEWNSGPSVTPTGLVAGVASTGALYVRPVTGGAWTKVGGAAHGDVAAAVPVAGATDVYVSAPDRTLWTIRSTAGRWGAWAKLDGLAERGPWADVLEGTGRTELWVARYGDGGSDLPWWWSRESGWQQVPTT